MTYKPYPAYHSQQPYTPISPIRPITPSNPILLSAPSGLSLQAALYSYLPYPAYHSKQAYSPYRPPPATYCPPADSQRFFNRWPFSLQKAIFYNAKCRVLHCKTRHFKSTLIISYLQTTCIIRSNCALPHPAQTLKSISNSLPSGGLGWVFLPAEVGVSGVRLWVLPPYHVTLMPMFTLAFELNGMNSLLVLPSRWSMPMKRL